MLDTMSRRTSVIIDDELVERARAALGTTGITDTIEAALREAVRADQRRRLIERFRTGEGIDFDAMLEARATWGDDTPPR
jgi:Arc/MetJ family transcription regulator